MSSDGKRWIYTVELPFVDPIEVDSLAKVGQFVYESVQTVGTAIRVKGSYVKYGATVTRRPM